MDVFESLSRCVQALNIADSLVKFFDSVLASEFCNIVTSHEGGSNRCRGTITGLFEWRVLGA